MKLKVTQARARYSKYFSNHNQMLIEKIREQSAPYHKDLESCSLLQPLASGMISKDHYIEVLKKFYAFFSSLEKNIEGIGKYLPDFSERRKAEFLLRDIKALGQDTTETFQVEVPQVKNDAYAFGCLYVMEGSTLGGKFIFENVQRCLPISNEVGGSFFYGYGKNTGAMWKAFIENLLSFYQHDQRENEILEGVKDTFVLLKKWLDKTK